MPGHQSRNFTDQDCQEKKITTPQAFLSIPEYDTFFSRLISFASRTSSQSGFVQILPFILLAFLGVSLVVGVVLVDRGGLGDIRSRAWSGVVVNVDNLRAKPQDPNPVKGTQGKDTKDSRELFHSLTRTYYTAEVQNISDPSVGVAGVALLQYDQKLNKTFVFTRIENLPVPATGFVRLWLVNEAREYQKAGVAEFFTEQSKPVSYSVFTRDGDLRAFKQLLFSYDDVLEGREPELVVISINF